MEHEARLRALDGTLEPVYYAGKAVGALRKHSDVLLIFLFKAACTEKYRDRYSGFGEPPKSDRDELLKHIHGKLARLAAQTSVGISTGKSTDPTTPSP